MNGSIVTPSKLLNPLSFTFKPKSFKSTHLYLEESRLKQKGLKNIFFKTIEKPSSLEPLPINMPVLTDTKESNVSLQRTTQKANKSCKIRKNVPESKPLQKNSIEIPVLSYKTFEKFHLPFVKTKVKLQTYSPKQIPVKAKEEIIEEIPEINKSLPLRIKISDYSKEYGSKIYRVNQVMKMLEIEDP